MTQNHTSLFSESSAFLFSENDAYLFSGNKLISYGNIAQKVKEKLKELKVNCNLSVVMAPQAIKEHDRGIFTNYLRIKSGDSFIYFDKNGKYKTKGTDIDFHSLTSADKFNASEAALKNLAHILSEIQFRPDANKRLFGDMKNNLLSSQT